MVHKASYNIGATISQAVENMALVIIPSEKWHGSNLFQSGEQEKVGQNGRNGCVVRSVGNFLSLLGS
jgi:hypothetical protein